MIDGGRGEEQSMEPTREHVLISPALSRSLAALGDDEKDAGAVALAIRYAELLDDAKAAEKFTKALRLCGEAVSSYADSMPITAAEQLMSAWDRIVSTLAEHSVASDLGPKLLASLAALNLTPAARAEKSKGGQRGMVAPPAGAPSPLQLLRDQARKRNGAA